MKPPERRRVPLYLALLAALLQTAHAQRPALEFRDIRDVFAATIATRDPVGVPPVAGEPQSRPTATTAPDPSLDAPVARLALDAAGLRAAASIPAGQVVGGGSPLIGFEIAGHAFRMAMIERVVDVDFDASHYLLVAPGSRDYARFTISRTGPEIVGTVFLRRSEYRILPDADGYQLVFPVVLHRADFRRERPPRLDTRSARLEARHLQMAWLAEHRPETFRTGRDGRLELYRSGAGRTATIGRIDLSRALRMDANGKTTGDPERLAEAVALFLNDIRHRTLIDEAVQVAIESADLKPLFDGSAASATVRFQQMIDGVPVDDDNYVEIDASGRVLVLSSDLMLPSSAERGGQARLDADEAESIAHAAVIERHGVDWPLQARERTLLYDYADEYTRLELLWKIVFGTNACELRYDVDVSALTGEILDLRETLDRITLSIPPRSMEAIVATCRD